MEETIEVTLDGGPASIPRTLSVATARLREGKLKIEHLGGYEHFELVDGLGGPDARPPRFSWTSRTKIAE